MSRPATLLTLLAASLLAGAPAFARDKAVAHGEYLVSLLGCGRCHTQGYLEGNDATGPYLAGSRVGIAYTDDENTTPGLAFAPNLTPDDETGIGTWSRRDIIRALTTGVGADGHQRLPVMPWPNYASLDDRDLDAIAAYLKSLKPVKRRIPRTTAPGDPVKYPYVRFGIFVFTPNGKEESAGGEAAPDRSL